MKQIFILLSLSLSISYAYSQKLTGHYSSGHEFLTFGSDSLVDFGLFIKDGGIVSVFKKGRGKCRMKDNFLIINIMDQPEHHFVDTTDIFSDTIQFFNLEGEPMAFTQCAFFNKEDSLIGGASSKLDNTISISNPSIDSVEVSSTGISSFGFKVTKGRGFKVYLQDENFLYRGQLILKITHIDNKGLSFKFIRYTTRRYEVSNKYLLNLKLHAFFTHHWTDLEKKY